MVNGQQFTPLQLLEAGHRAETEGRLELAAQFYRHITEYFAFTPEAAEARNGLGRLSAAPHPLWPLNGASPANGAARPRPRVFAPRDHYRIERALCRFLTAAGWAAIACGIGAPALHAGVQQFAELPLPQLTWAQLLTAAVALIGAGLLLALSGQIARAVFDQANATRDLAALERARAWPD